MAARPGPPPFAENTRESSPETRWQYTGSMVPLDCMPRPANALWKFVICVRRRAQLGQRSRVSTGVLEGRRSSAGAGGAAFLCVSCAVPPVGDLHWNRPSRPVLGPVRARLCNSPPGALNFLQGACCIRYGARTVCTSIHGGSNRAGFSQLDPLGPALSPLGVVVVTATSPQ
jgi:hypothetical protein